MTRPLEGIRVIDMSHVIAGPMASFLLTHLGAEVIKVEAPEGGDVWRAGQRKAGEGGTNTGFTALNAGKRSLAIDIRQPAGAEIVRALASTADIFIENFRPGTVARYGLDFDSIRKVRPAIVYCSISGYGQQGAYSSRGAYDNVVQALTGMMMMSGEGEDAPPMKVGFPVVDVGAGMLAALAVTAALARRAAHPEGQYIDVSMVQAALMLMYPQATSCLTFQKEIPRTGNRGFSGSPGSDTYRCNDGWLAIAANTPAQFRKLTALLGLEELCEDPQVLDLDAFNDGGFVVPVDLPLLEGRLRAALAVHSAVDLERRLNEAGIPSAKVRRLGDFLGEWQSAGMAQGFKSYPQGDRHVRTPGPGFHFLDEGSWPAQQGPELGGDSAAVLTGLGLDDVAISQLVTSGIVLGPQRRAVNVDKSRALLPVGVASP